MPDLGDALASDAAHQIVTAMVSGLVGLVGKIPSLWSRAGKRRQELISAELERSSAALSHASSDDLPTVQLRLEGAWEGRLRDLLAEEPEVAGELRILVAEMMDHSPRGVQMVQNINASAPGATSQGAMFGNVINHRGVPRGPTSATPHPADADAAPGEP